MRLAATLLLLSGCLTPAVAADPTPPDPKAPAVAMPSEVKAKAGRYARVTVSYVGDDVKWWIDDVDAVDLFQEYNPKPNEIVLRVGGDAGTYHLHAIAASCANGKAALSKVGDCLVTIGAPQPPTPPGPTPGPTPSPDSFTSAVQLAYNKDTDASKARKVAFLSAVYKAGEALLTADVKTYADLFSQVSVAVHVPNIGVPKGGLPNVMATIGDELNRTFGTDPAAAVDATKVRAEFAKIADALGRVQ